MRIDFSQANLRNLSTSDCAAALSSYHSHVAASCAADTWLGPGDEEQPVAMISETIRYHYNFTCLTDNVIFCNNVAAAFAAAANSKTGGELVMLNSPLTTWTGCQSTRTLTSRVLLPTCSP